VVSIESVRGTSPTVREGSVKRESMILTEQHVLDCFFHISFLSTDKSYFRGALMV